MNEPGPSRPRRPLAVIAATFLALPALQAAPPVVQEHPRLFLRASDLSGLRDRCRSDPTVKAAYDPLRAFAYGTSMHANLWVAPDELSSVLLAYLVESRDPALLGRARRYLEAFSRATGDEWTAPRMLKALAHAYDWLHQELSEDERRSCAGRIVELAEQIRKLYRHSDYNNHVYLQYGPILYAGLALAGEGVADDFAREAISEGETLLKVHFIPTVNQVGGGSAGGWHESMSYWSFFAYEFAHQLEAWRTATGENLFPACEGLRGAAQWLLYCTRPHDASMAPVGDINTPAPWGWQESAYLPLVAARYRDGVAQRCALDMPPKYATRAWPYVLWLDPSVEATRVDSLPTGTLFPGIGWAAMRGSWARDAAWALFVCGDSYSGHQHADQNSFFISRGGNLAIDAGEYGAKATSFHNTVMIGEGQRVSGNDPRRFYGPISEGSEFDTGDILAFEEHEDFTYVVGDASNAYGVPPATGRGRDAPRFVRRFIFLKPSTFVVDDLVGTPAGMGEARWLLNANERPEIAGRRIRIADGSGELLCETILPEEATIRTEERTGGRRSLSHYLIEVLPNAPSESSRFVHVLHTRARGDETSVARGTLSTQEGHRLLTVTAEDRLYELTLPPTTAAAGSIAIKSAGGTTLLERRLLPSGVLPWGPSGLQLLERWERSYRSGRPGWDTGRPSSELRKAVEDGTIKPGRTVVLGCGTGTNAVYLARRGFDVTAIDIAPTALARGEEKARENGVTVQWLLADVLALPKLEPFDFIFDRGCYHGLRRTSASRYCETVRRLSRPGTRMLLLAGNAKEEGRPGPPRVKEEELKADFSELFAFEWLREIRFDTANGDAMGALAWSVLLGRKP